MLSPGGRSRTSPIVGIEPSCTAVLRHDAVDLLGTAEARDVGNRSSTLAELLSRDEHWSPPDLRGTNVVAQPHCHHHAVMGWEVDAALLARAGAAVDQVGGCCGLAGNFGMEKGHYEVSVAVAEQQLSPCAAQAEPETPVLADGFSCRTQVGGPARDGTLSTSPSCCRRADLQTEPTPLQARGPRASERATSSSRRCHRSLGSNARSSRGSNGWCTSGKVSRLKPHGGMGCLLQGSYDDLTPPRCRCEAPRRRRAGGRSLRATRGSGCGSSASRSPGR